MSVLMSLIFISDSSYISSYYVLVAKGSVEFLHVPYVVFH